MTSGLITIFCGPDVLYREFGTGNILLPTNELERRHIATALHSILEMLGPTRPSSAKESDYNEGGLQTEPSPCGHIADGSWLRTEWSDNQST